MILQILLISAALAVLFFLLALKLKKLRLLPILLMLVSLVPVGACGLILAGYGEYIGYPALPGVTVVQMNKHLSQGDFNRAEDYLIGTLGASEEITSEAGWMLLQAMMDGFSVELAEEVAVDGFVATAAVTVTHVNLEAWLDGLERETVAALDQMVQSTRKSEIFNEEGTDYLTGVTDRAYDEAFARMLGKTGEYLSEDTLELQMIWTPFGWRVLPNEAFTNLLEGYTLGAEDVYVVQGAVSDRISARLQTAQGEILDAVPFIEKIYTIAADATYGPVPDPAAFGSTTDPYEVLEVVKKAEKLLDGRTLSWNPDIEIKDGSKIQYYYDETILAIQWKEWRNWSLVTFAEVVLQDGSQIRRCISGDSYRNFAWETPTQMSQRTNSVIAITGDFYMYRAIGIMTYQGEVYRDEPQSLHHLWVTNSGDLLMTKSWEVSQENARSFVEENDVSFSLAFGPAIIENGEKLEMPRYLVGEFYDDYPRCAIGEVDHLHYILMTVGEEGPRENQTVTLPEAVNYIYEKGVQTAYALDGGRTANMTFNGELTNDPPYRKERTMSDLIYFCSAIPEDQR